MERNATELRQMVMEFLQRKATKWDLSAIEAGKEEVLAEAVVGIKTDFAGRPRLVVRTRGSGVAIEVRKITRLGSAGSINNRAVCSCLTGIFFSGLPEDQYKAGITIQLLQLMAQQYMTTPRTAEELLAAVICGSNDGVNRTRAVVDTRDGECYVDIVIPGDSEEFADELEEAAAAALQHAVIIARFIRTARELILPDQSYAIKSAVELLGDLLQKGENQQDGKGQKTGKNANRGKASREAEMVL